MTIHSVEKNGNKTGEQFVAGKLVESKTSRPKEDIEWMKSGSDQTSLLQRREGGGIAARGGAQRKPNR